MLVTNTLPDGVVLVSAPSGWSQSNPLIGSLGDLDANTQRSVALLVKATHSGLFSDKVNVGSSVPGNKGKNSASAKILVNDPPSVKLLTGANGLSLSWPVGSSFVVQSATSLVAPINWVDVTNPAPVTVNGEYVVPVTYSNGTKFFRLQLRTP